MRETIKKYLADHYEEYVKDLETLTNIDSGNGDRRGSYLRPACTAGSRLQGF